MRKTFLDVQLGSAPPQPMRTPSPIEIGKAIGEGIVLAGFMFAMGACTTVLAVAFGG